MGAAQVRVVLLNFVCKGRSLKIGFAEDDCNCEHSVTLACVLSFMGRRCSLFTKNLTLK